MPILAPNSALEISYSSLNTFNSCERKFEFAKFYKHYSRSESLAAEVGKALHIGFQNWMQYEDLDKATTAMMFAYPWHLNKNPGDFRSAEACYATLEEMIHAHELHGYEIAQIQSPDGALRPAIEVPFVIELVGLEVYDDPAMPRIPIIYRGFMDLILYSRLQDKYVVTDIKTHRDNMKDLTAKYFFDDQCTPYSMVLERILGKPVDVLDSKIMAVYVDIKNPCVQTYDFTKDADDVADWARNLLTDIQRIKSHAAFNWWPRRGNKCVNFKKVCSNFEVCQNRNEDYIQEVFLSGEQSKDKFEFDPWVTMQLELAA